VDDGGAGDGGTNEGGTIAGEGAGAGAGEGEGGGWITNLDRALAACVVADTMRLSSCVDADANDLDGIGAAILWALRGWIRAVLRDLYWYVSRNGLGLTLGGWGWGGGGGGGAGWSGGVCKSDKGNVGCGWSAAPLFMLDRKISILAWIDKSRYSTGFVGVGVGVRIGVGVGVGVVVGVGVGPVGHVNLAGVGPVGHVNLAGAGAGLGAAGLGVWVGHTNAGVVGAG